MRPDVILDGARLAALRDLGVLDTKPEEDFDRFTRLATELLGVPVSLVSLVDSGRQFFKSEHGLSGELAQSRQTPLSHSFCQYAVDSKQPFVVTDAREHPLVADNLAIRDLDVIAYAGIPLVLADGNAVGTMCAVDERPRSWSEREITILKDLAAAVQSQLELRRAVAQRSLHDQLTGLPNRALLIAHADHLLSVAAAGRKGMTVAICADVDGFRLVNEAFGPATADRVLAAVAEALAGAVRIGDVLGRLGGDTFAVLCREVEDERGALVLAQRLGDAVAGAEIEAGGERLGVTVTIGVATGERERTGSGLLVRADDAMRRAKLGPGRVRMAEDAHAELAATRLRMRAAIGGAVRRGEVGVHFQPLVELATGERIGFEALARWTHPELGRVSPVDFIPLAEQTGDIIEIGEAILHEACRQLSRLRGASGPLRVQVNLAPLQLEQPGIVDIVESVLRDNELPGDAVVLEVTEGALIDANPLHARTLDGLRELGVRIALDDFGTGYSALAYLKRFRIDQLKIDRSFIEGIEATRFDRALVEAIIAFAGGVDIEVVAEGIETPRQRQLLGLLGCRYGQGFLFAPPCPADEIA